jgi:hypothetical protein
MLNRSNSEDCLLTKTLDNFAVCSNNSSVAEQSNIPSDTYLVLGANSNINDSRIAGLQRSSPRPGVTT